MSPPVVAVIDVGSNSARVVVYRMGPGGELGLVASTRAGLGLVSDVDARGSLGADASRRVVEALADFRAVAVGAGAPSIIAVATAAMRDAADGPELLSRIRRELGLEVRILTGQEEASYGFLGGVRGLPVSAGLLFDMGGGSLQLTHFARRGMLRTWSLPLGALRLSKAYLSSDPPRHKELRALAGHVAALLAAERIPRLGKGETLVGTGGTVRNLAKIDARHRSYPIERVHGYPLRRSHLEKITSRLVARRTKDRGRVPGLSDGRADSIVGGAAALGALLRALGAEELIVSGMGVREGIAYAASSPDLPSPEDSRRSSILALCSRFRDYDPDAAARRAQLAQGLLSGLVPEAGREIDDALGRAATLLDVGRSVDFFDRHRHAADIILEAELNGFEHREIALASAIVRVAGDPKSAPQAYRPLLGGGDWGRVVGAGALLAVADDIERRCDPRVPLRHECRVRQSEVVLTVRGLVGWRPQASAHRFERAFGRSLVVKAEPGA